MMLSFRSLFVVVILSSSCPPTIDAFTPNMFFTLPQLAFSSRTHKDITRDAHVAIARQVMSENPDLFTDPSVTLSRSGFRQAADDLQDAVPKPDFGTYQASEHFDNEQFDAGNKVILTLLLQIRQDIRAKSMSTAREKTGRALHTIQDFYSHSNWIEMYGSAVTHPQVGVENIVSIDDQAGTGDKCCINCTGIQKLTSGYFEHVTIGEALYGLLFGTGGTKPAGKCSHGYILDWTSYPSPFSNGINKDTTESPRGSFHFQAAEAAMQNTIRFIDSIRKNSDDPIEDKDFFEFLGLTLGKTLCFVVDTTGSMSEEIAGVQAATIAMVRATLPSAGGELPSNYLLVPFNDPGYGPALTTTVPDTMISWLAALTATGGGDEPELAFHGLQLAIDNVRPGSTCYFYTDASAKDSSLFPYVLSNAIQRKVEIVQFFTSVVYGRRRRRSSSRQKRSAYSYYDALVKMTGGSMYEIRKSDSQKVSELVIGLETRKSQVTLFTATKTLNNLSAEILVDQSLDNAFLMLSGTALPYITGIQVTSPSGVPFNSFNQTLDTPNVKGYNFTSLTTGRWSVKFNTSFSSTVYSLSSTVTATSIVSFTYQFTVESSGMHGGYEPIAGNPVVGTDYVIAVTVYGAVDPTSGNPTGLVRNVTSLLFVSMTGDVLVTLPLTQVENLQTYVVQTQIPKTAFRVALQGIDNGGNVIQRYDTSVMEPKVTVININVTSLSQVRPGASVDADVIVTSSEPTLSSWCLYALDTGNFYSGPRSRNINIGRNISANVTLNFKIPSNISYGYVSTASVSVGNCGLTSVDNFYVFYLTVERQTNDTAPPVIEITSQVFPCNETNLQSQMTSNCGLYSWTVQFQVYDVDSGLRYLTVVSAAPQNASSLFFEPFEEGTQSTVVGNYTTTCCYPTATLRAVDGSGQVSSVTIGGPATGVTTPRSGSESVMFEGSAVIALLSPLLLVLLSHFVMI